MTQAMVLIDVGVKDPLMTFRYPSSQCSQSYLSPASGHVPPSLVPHGFLLHFPLVSWLTGIRNIKVQAEMMALLPVSNDSGLAVFAQ